MKKIFVLIAIVAAAAMLIVGYYTLRPAGTLEIATPGGSVELQKLFGSQTVSSAAPARLGSGTYAVKSVTLEKSSGSDSWTVSTTGPLAKLAKVTIEKDKTTTLNFGPPFTVKSEIQQENPSSISVGFLMTGSAGEQYLADITKNDLVLGPPAVKILDANGAVLASGKFKFG
jgi:hypothetical protein